MASQLDVAWPSLVPSECRYGFNVQPVAGQLALVQAAGGRLVRWGCGWQSLEDPVTGALAVPSKTVEGLRLCLLHGLVPFVTLSFAPPFRRVATVKLANQALKGSYRLVLSEPWVGFTGQFRQYVQKAAGGGQVSGKVTTAGTMIAAVEGNEVVLTSALSTALAQNTTLNINEGRYAPIHTAAAADAGAVAFMRAARFLVEEAALLVPEGRVCLQNEFLWPKDKWANGLKMWDVAAWDSGEGYAAGELASRGGVVYRAAVKMTAGAGAREPPNALYWEAAGGPAPACPDGWVNNRDMAAILLRAASEPALPAGWRYVNGGSDVSAKGILELASPPNAAESADIDDGVHPYGENPEIGALNAALESINPSYDANQAVGKMVRTDRLAEGEGFSVGVAATECGTVRPDYSERQQAKYNLRRILSLLFQGIPPLIYDLLSVLEEGPVEESGILPESGAAFLAVKRLGEILAALGPDGSSSDVPSASFPGASWHWCAGGVAGTTGSVLFLWQRTALLTHEPSEPARWGQIPVPEAVGVPVALRGGMREVKSVVNLVTGEAVPFAGGLVPVADEPVAVIVGPVVVNEVQPPPAGLTVRRSDLFPVGTQVRAFPASARYTGLDLMPRGVPLGEATVAADGSLSFVELKAGRKVVLAAEVDGEPRLLLAEVPLPVGKYVPLRQRVRAERQTVRAIGSRQQ